MKTLGRAQHAAPLQRPGISEELLLIVIAAVSICVTALILLTTFWIEDVWAGEYFIYKDAAGKITISNQPLRYAQGATQDKRIEINQVSVNEGSRIFLPQKAQRSHR